MNWKLILQLSLFGLAMGIGTVFVIASQVEPYFWVAIFLVCAYVIAKRAPGRYFLHGLLVSVVNSVWITGFHVLLFRQYIGSHAQEAAMMASMPLVRHPRLLMLLTGPVVGLVSGIVLGLFAAIAGKFVARPAQAGTGRSA
jgi:hypothetical protein